MNNPKVSVVVTTKNEEENIENCLASIKKQTYKNIESIVVDNNSTDKTKEIAKKYTRIVLNKGPERSAQRNFGAHHAEGKYILFIDADMILTESVIEECVHVMDSTQCGGLVIPEKSFGTSFWAKVKALERSFYLGNMAIEAARFFNRHQFLQIGGFDESITGPEDWDFSQRIKKVYGLSRISAFILHNEGELSLIKTAQKKYYYAKKFTPYIVKKDNQKDVQKQFGIINRYMIFLSHPKKLFSNPLLGIAVLVMKTTEFAAGGIGFVEGKYKKL